MKFRSHFRILILISLIALATTSVFSQAPPIGGYRSPSEDPNAGRLANERHLSEARQRMNEMKRRQDEINDRRLHRTEGPVFVFKSESKLNAKERMLLATHPEDQQKYAEFLRGPGTGLFRLLPLESGSIVTVEALESGAGILPIMGRGAYYSYSKLRHDLDDWSEIALINETFQVGFARKSLGLMGLLGDVPLEAVTLDTNGVGYLYKLVPPAEYQEMVEQSDKNLGPLYAGENTYSSIMAVRHDTTYVLRSTTYGKADILVAFRVIRQDADGSLHILWKKLASYPAPTLKGKPKN